MLPHPLLLQDLVKDWLKEDLGRGDRTTMGLFPAGAPRGQAVWLAKAMGVICGLPIAELVFASLDPQVQFTPLVAEGTAVSKGQEILQIESDLASLLIGERVALNLVMKLSGISTLTRQYVQKIRAVSGRVQLLDTRKLTPCLRLLEKYATYIGGAVNHRLGLDDWAMVKDNHIVACGGIAPAVERLRQNLPFLTPIEVEVDTIEQLQEVIPLGVQAILLDNMSISELKEAIPMIRQGSPHTKIEVSGGITLENISEVASLDVDYISTSATITRASWLDISMEIRH
ncbi:MAG: carboxylating nicotinate-nucleotide diphosphorylase [Pseudanabaenaceae cyanobacterium]